jgi:hypothetical protein
MTKSDLPLATAAEATQPLEKLRSGIADRSGAYRIHVISTGAADVLAFLRAHPGSLLYEIAEALSLKVRDAEVATRELMRVGLASSAAGEDGIVRWWP